VPFRYHRRVTRALLASLITLAALGGTPAEGQIHRWVDEAGNVHYGHGIQSVPERPHAGLAAHEREAARQALAALRELGPFAGPATPPAELEMRLAQMNRTVSASLTRLSPGPLREALAEGQRAYLGLRVVNGYLSDLRPRLHPLAASCPPLVEALEKPGATRFRLDRDVALRDNARAALVECGRRAITAAESAVPVTSPAGAGQSGDSRARP